LARRKSTPEGAAAELYSLLEIVTADGRLSDEEVRELAEWLNANRSIVMPKLETLRALAEQILADGVITTIERRELQKAVERILPLDARQTAKERRAAADAVDKLNQRAEREAERVLRLANRPVTRPSFMVAGVLYEDRAAIVDAYAREGDAYS
jgi:hypothetical protein